MNESLASGEIPGGYHGRYLRVDASSGRGEFISLQPQTLRKYIGGSGLGTWLLLREAAAEQEPLAPESCIAFVFSPLVGSPLTTSAKFAVVSKSPLTGRINDSLASSGFAIAGKKAGCDAIVITGRAPKLSILVIDDGLARFEPAENLRGTSCPQAEKLLHESYPGYSFAVIGPAGETLVRYATISHDGRHAGRGGSGAVLGAKNIKAIAIRGTQRTEFAHPQKLVSLAKNFSERSFGPATAKYRELGTATNLLVFNRLKALPTRNFQAGSFAEAEAIAPETLTLVRDKTRASCAACTIGCEHIYSLKPGHTSGGISSSSSSLSEAGVRLEYENLFALGPLCGIADPQIVLTASKKCDELGIDTISAGGTIAFAMECVERGLLEEPWLRFGDGESLLKALDLIGRREGLGNRLAEGSRHLALSLGGDALDFAPQVKGLELPGYEPRALQSMALGFAVGSRGADHNRSGAYEVDFSEQADRRNLVPATALLAIETEDKAALMDSLILCKFLRGIFSDFFAETADMLRLVTGWDVTADELRDVSRRVVAAKKLFNERAGWTAAEDTLPARFLNQTLSDDPAAHLSRQQLAAVIAAYYQARGWTSDGTLDAAALASLGLE
ncbi:MAG: aldehyde ferredoxin oxidoreductase family protein [Planctomycetales bacterium]|nr:aldehyde ferredoxin oxidoreductase family protein [Planctomycetales bacterium]